MLSAEELNEFSALPPPASWDAKAVLKELLPVFGEAVLALGFQPADGGVAVRNEVHERYAETT